MIFVSKISGMVERKLVVCRYCEGDKRHTCTSFTCGEAVAEAKRQYRNERKRRMEEGFVGSDDKEHYGKTIMEALHEILQVEPGEDINSIRRLYSLDEILDAVLVYEGLIGYSEKLIRIIEEIFKVNLLELDV